MGSGSATVRGGRGTVALIAVAAFALLWITSSPGAEASQVRNVQLHNGPNSVQLRVEHTTRDLPPAIVFSTRPRGDKCSVRSYRYGNRQARGRFSSIIFCRGLDRGARARFVFRAPYKREFDLQNGSHVIRVSIDKPRGRALPLGSLTTRPRNTDCEVFPAGRRVGAHRFKARAKMACEDVPPGSTGVLGVGGLVTPDRAFRMRSAVVSDDFRAEAPPVAPGASVSARVPDGKCEEPTVVAVKGFKTLHWKDCYTGSFTLGPWQTQWIGIGGPSPQCESGWSRTLSFHDAPPAYLLVMKRGLEMDTDPESWWYSWYNITGTVTNWQFSGDVNFRFIYRCFRVE